MVIPCNQVRHRVRWRPGKKQVRRHHIQTRGVLGVNLPYWKKYLQHFWAFSAPDSEPFRPFLGLFGPFRLLQHFWAFSAPDSESGALCLSCAPATPLHAMQDIFAIAIAIFSNASCSAVVSVCFFPKTKVAVCEFVFSISVTWTCKVPWRKTEQRIPFFENIQPVGPPKKSLGPA